MNELEQRVAQTIQSRQLLRRGAAVLVAVSGGLDSMCLLHLMHRLAPACQWRLVVAHFNHQLRGRASAADERLVRKTAAALGLPCLSERGAVRVLARKDRLSLEMAARQMRHQFLARAARQFGAGTIALAHQADDQVELFFLRLLRGAGSEGLAGMAWTSPAPGDPRLALIRPLLDVPKNQLAAFARRERIAYREDASNASLAIQRNRIRRELIPLLRRRYQPALDRIVTRYMEIAAADDEWLGHLADDWLRRKTGRPFVRLPAALQRRIIQRQLIGLGVAPEFGLIERLRCESDHAVSVSAQQAVTRDAAGRLQLERIPRTRFKVAELAVDVAPRSGRAEFGGAKLRWRWRRHGPRTAVSRSRGCERFDADRIGLAIILRHWRPGDRFHPIGMRSAVKLQDVFTNLKIPRARRHALIVAAASSGEIFWVEGLRISENFKLTAATKRELEWRWRR